MGKFIPVAAFGIVILMGGQVWAQYGPPPVIGRQAAAADTGGVGSYGDTMDALIGNGTRTQWGMARGLTGEATLGSGINGYSAMGLGGHGQTTGAAQILPYYSLGGEAGAVNYGSEQFGLGATPGFGRIWSGPNAYGGTTLGYGSLAAWPSSYAAQSMPQRGIPAEQLRGLIRVTPTPYAPPGNPGFVDPGVAGRANEYTYGTTRPAGASNPPAPRQTLTGSRSAYPPAVPQPPK
ncbi:MAG TPA: hypothetical protein VIK18_23155 [Pirellulales bacterium]